MRIAYCTNVRLPSERAHGHQIAQVCDALSALGHEVTIFAPHRRNPIQEDLQTYYGMQHHVGLRLLGTFDAINRPWLPGVLGLWMLNLLLRANLKKALAGHQFDVIYTRSPAILPALLSSCTPVILELHQLPRRHRPKFVEQCNKCVLVACLTTSMRDALVGWGVPKEKVIAEGDGVDLHRFTHLQSVADARHGIPLTTNRLVVGYIGRLKTLGMEKGVKHLLEALKELQHEKKFMGLVVGGPKDDTDEYKEMAKQLGLTNEDVRFTGEVPAQKVPAMLAACDVLAMPFPDFPHYRYHMSPLKMFEYMAAGKIIVTSDLPTVRDVLAEEAAYFCAPGDSHSLADVLRRIHEHPAEASKKAEASHALAEHYSWEQRMLRVLSAASLNA